MNKYYINISTSHSEFFPKTCLFFIFNIRNLYSVSKFRTCIEISSHISNGFVKLTFEVGKSFLFGFWKIVVHISPLFTWHRSNFIFFHVGEYNLFKFTQFALWIFSSAYIGILKIFFLEKTEVKSVGFTFGGGGWLSPFNVFLQ